MATATVPTPHRRTARHVPDQRNRLRRVLRRQREAGGALLPGGVRLPARRLSRPGDRRARPRELSARSRTRSASCSRRRSGRTATIAEHVHKHGDGVRDIALWVDDARDAYAKAVERGASPRARAARRCATTTAKSSSPAIKIYGDTIHSLVERKNYRGLVPARLPAARRRTTRRAEAGLQYVDHCVGNVELGQDERVGRVLRARDGLQEPDLVRRRGHLARSTRR